MAPRRGEERELHIKFTIGGKEVEKTFRRAGAGAEDLEESVAGASARLEQMEEAAGEAGQGVRRHAAGAADALEDLAGEASDAGASLERAGERGAQGARSMGAAATQAGGQVASMGKRSSTANQALFEIAAATQDAQYGFRGVSNQIPQLVEMLTRLKTQSGGTRGALESILGALKGPAGLIAGFAALEFATVTLGPMIKKAFSDGEDSVEEFQERAEEAADAILQIRSRVEELQAEVGVEQAEGLIEGLEADKKRLQESLDLYTELRSVAGGGSDVEQLFDVSDLERVGREFGAGVFPTEVLQRMNSGAEAIRVTESQQQSIADALERQGVSREEINDDLRVTGELLDTQRDRLKDIETMQRARRIAEENGVEFAEDMSEAIAGAADETEAITEATERYAQFQEDLATKDAFRDLSEADESREKVRFLTQALEALEEKGVDPASEAVQTLRGELSATRAQQGESAKTTEQATTKLGELTQQLREYQEADLGAIAAYKNKTQAVEERVSAYERLVDTLATIQREGTGAEAAGIEPWLAATEEDIQAAMPEEVNASGGIFQSAMTRLGRLARLEDAGRRSGPEAAAESVGVLEQALDDMAAAGKAGTAEYQILEDTLERSQRTVEDTGDAVLSTADIVASVGSAAFNALGSAIENADSAAEGLQETLSSVLQSAGSLMTQFGLQTGNVPLAIGGQGLSLLGGLVPGFAGGTRSAPAGWKVVGEEGPELMHTPGGETILPAEDTRAMLSAATVGAESLAGQQRAGGGALRREIADLRASVEALAGGADALREGADTFTSREPRARVSVRDMRSGFAQQARDDAATGFNL